MRAPRRVAALDAWDPRWGSAFRSSFHPTLFLIALSQKDPQPRLLPAAPKLLPVGRRRCRSGLLFLAVLEAPAPGTARWGRAARPTAPGGSGGGAVLRPPRCFLSGASRVPFISALHAVRKGRPKAEDGSGGHRRSRDTAERRLLLIKNHSLATSEGALGAAAAAGQEGKGWTGEPEPGTAPQRPAARPCRAPEPTPPAHTPPHVSLFAPAPISAPRSSLGPRLSPT